MLLQKKGWGLHLKVVHRKREREGEISFFLHFMKRKDIVNDCHTCPCMGIMREEIKKRRKGKMYNEIKKNGRWSINRNSPDWLTTHAYSNIFFSRSCIDAYAWWDKNMLTINQSIHILCFSLFFSCYLLPNTRLLSFHYTDVFLENIDLSYSTFKSHYSWQSSADYRMIDTYIE